MRSLYRFLLCLHPADFRERFGNEMLCIFDEAGDASARTPFLADVTISLVRQWLDRIQLWKWAIATLGGMISVFCGFGGFLTWQGIWEAVRAVF